MTKGNMNREQAITKVGDAAVKAVESMNCDFTNRVQTDGDTRVEFSASVQAQDSEGLDVTLVAYYYQDAEDLEGVEDLGSLNWTVAGYAVI